MQSNSASDTTYWAPLHNCDLPAEDLSPDDYIVYLVPDYTLDQHKQKVGPALSDSIRHVLENLYPDKICYNAILSQELLASVRSDPGVELVECNPIATPDGMNP